MNHSILPARQLQKNKAITLAFHASGQSLLHDQKQGVPKVQVYEIPAGQRRGKERITMHRKETAPTHPQRHHPQ